jgi:cell division protein FtsB
VKNAEQLRQQDDKIEKVKNAGQLRQQNDKMEDDVKLLKYPKPKL